MTLQGELKYTTPVTKRLITFAFLAALTQTNLNKETLYVRNEEYGKETEEVLAVQNAQCWKFCQRQQVDCHMMYVVNQEMRKAKISPIRDWWSTPT